jgi:hypothetical protein
MESTRGWARSGHSISGRFVTVMKLAATNTATTPSTANSLAARGEVAGSTGSEK